MKTKQSVYVVCSDTAVQNKELRALLSCLARDYDLIKANSPDQFYQATLRDISLYNRIPGAFLCDLAVPGEREARFAVELSRAYPAAAFIAFEDSPPNGFYAEIWLGGPERRLRVKESCACARIQRAQVASALVIW